MRLYLLFLFRELFHFQPSTITLYESNYLCLHFYIPVELGDVRLKYIQTCVDVCFVVALYNRGSVYNDMIALLCIKSISKLRCVVSIDQPKTEI